jgi:hypothetical protein
MNVIQGNNKPLLKPVLYAFDKRWWGCEGWWPIDAVDPVYAVAIGISPAHAFNNWRAKIKRRGCLSLPPYAKVKREGA